MYVCREWVHIFTLCYCMGVFLESFRRRIKMMTAQCSPQIACAPPRMGSGAIPLAATAEANATVMF
jgi:hypothetical protein